jgi:Tc5 transposase DNA-binding domain
MRANYHKLTDLEEQTLVEWVLDMDSRGFPLRIMDLCETAQLLLQERDPNSKIGRDWPTNFVNRTPSLKAKFNRKYDYARALSEDPEKIEAWFNLVRNVRTKYGIQDDDVYNFDETGYILGIAATTKVITAADKQKPKQVQPGNREWVTAVECINACG